MDNVYTKYDIQVPRYTSYPSVPHWVENITAVSWIEKLKAAFITKPQWSLYLHIPFCETLCTFCGCTNIITKNHSREMDYLELLLKELDFYQKAIPNISQSPLQYLHLGGGSPTFISPINTHFLLEEIFKRLNIKKHFHGSVEVDPRRTKPEHLEVYRDFSFNRISLGVQDFSPYVQKIINRHQTFEQTEAVVTTARKLGYTSINIDLIYGLPLQTSESMIFSIEKTLLLKPERIALYSYAKVPWIKPQQKLFRDSDLPQGLEKAKLFRIARDLLLEAGYAEIGMDHFALPEDGLSQSQSTKTLNRNFMGYVEHKTDVLLGLGLSSISDIGTTFHQNYKKIEDYTSSVLAEQCPSLKGYELSQKDLRNRKKITELMTQLQTTLESKEEIIDAYDYLKPMIDDGLVCIENDLLSVTKEGKTFLRNVCSFFDEYYRQAGLGRNVYSMSL